MITNPREISNELADNFMKNSSNENYNINFLRKKLSEEKQKRIINNDIQNKLKTPLLKTELKITINEMKSQKSPGSHNTRIVSDMIKKLHDEALDYILKINNHIWLKN